MILCRHLTPPSLPPSLPQDLGNYERFLHVRLTNDSNLTTGKVYQSVIERERKGEYLGASLPSCLSLCDPSFPLSFRFAVCLTLPLFFPCILPSTLTDPPSLPPSLPAQARRCRLSLTSPTPSRTGSSG